MRPGGWSMQLDAGCPQYIVDRVRAALATYDGANDRWDAVNDGQIVVFDTDTDTPSLAEARYTGIVREQEATRTFSGPGVAGYWQTDDGLGPLQDDPAGVTYSARALSSWGSVVAPFNGITVGTISDTGLSSVGMTWPLAVGPRELFDAVCSRMGAEWRINPDGTLDAGANIFNTSPRVLVSAQPDGRAGGLRGVRGSIMSPAINGRNLSSKVIVVGEGEGATVTVESSSTVAAGKGLDGSTLRMERAVDSPNDPSTNAQALADSTLGLWRYPRSSFGVSSSSEYTRRDVEPGDDVYCYFPEAGIVGSDPVTFRGEPIYPQRARLHSINWGVHEGHGVYLRRHNGTTETWTRLTPWVVFEDSQAFWTVGSGAGPSDESQTAGIARLGAAATITERAAR